MIDVPPKIWRPKPENKYIPLDYATDVDEGVFDFAHHGNTVFRPRKRCADKERDNLITFDAENDMADLPENLKVGINVLPVYQARVKAIIMNFWDCFCVKGARRPILDDEFSIDTGASPPVYFRRPAYGPHEKPIITEQIDSLLANDWIEECGVAWGSMIVLAAKTHQEHIKDI